MTSRNLFSKMIRISLRGKIWSLALACIGLFFAFPVYSALYITSVNNRIAYGSYMKGVALALFRKHILGESNAFVGIVMVFLAMFIAFNGFSYLFSKSKVDLYHGIPVKREMLFLVEYVSGLIVYIVPYVLFLLLSLIVAGANGVLDGAGIVASLIMLVINLLGFFAVYNTTIIGIMLTGNLSVAVIGTFVLMGYIPFCTWLVTLYQYIFFKTYSSYAPSPFGYKLSPITAFCSLMDGMDSYSGIFELRPINFLLVILFCLFTCALAIYLYKIRPSEAASQAMAFKKTMPVIAVMLLVALGLFGGVGFEELSRNGGRISYTWYVFGVIISLIIGHLVIQAIYHFDFKSMFKNLVSPAIAAVIIAVFASIFIFDLTGYDKYVPQDDKYEYASVSSYGMQNGVDYYNFDVRPDEYGGYNVWVDTDTYRLNNMKLTDKAVIKELVAAGYEDTLAEDEWVHNQTYDGQEITEEAKESDILYTEVYVKYTINKNHSVYRKYYLDLSKRIDLYDKLYRSEGYKEGVFTILGLEGDDIDDIGYYGFFGEDSTLKLTKDQMRELVETYKKDLMKQDAYSLRDEIPCGYIFKKVVVKENNYSSNYFADKGFVYPSFTNTVSLLNSYGIITKLEDYSDSVDSLSISRYDYKRVAEAEETISQQYTDKDKIKEILTVCVPYEFLSVEAPLHPSEDIDVNAHYLGNPSSFSENYSFSIEKGNLPEYVKKDMKF